MSTKHHIPCREKREKGRAVAVYNRARKRNATKRTEGAKMMDENIHPPTDPLLCIIDSDTVVCRLPPANRPRVTTFAHPSGKEKSETRAKEQRALPGHIHTLYSFSIASGHGRASSVMNSEQVVNRQTVRTYTTTDRVLPRLIIESRKIIRVRSEVLGVIRGDPGGWLFGW